MDSSQEAFASVSLLQWSWRGRPPASLTHCSHTNCSESGAGYAPLSYVSSLFITVINRKLAIFTHLSTDVFQAEHTAVK